MATRSLFVVVLGLIIGGCGGGGKSTPIAPTPTVTNITVTSPSDLLFIGATDTFTATATLSDGTTQAITSGGWGSDERHIVSVDATSGRVTGVGSGNAVIFINYQGQRGTKTIRGLPNYQGAWSGSYGVRGCSQSGQIAAANICGDTFSVNRVLPMNLLATQTRDAVTTQIFLGMVAGSGNGPVQISGEWLLAGTARSGDLSIDTTWALQSSQDGRIFGSGGFILRFAGLTGEARINVEIRDLNRTSSAAGFVPPHGALVRSLSDLAAAIAGR